MTIRSLLALAGITFALAGCAIVQAPTSGVLYTSVQGPLTVGDSTKSDKMGQACAHNYLGLVSTGDASVDAAKKAGGISHVSSVDSNSTTVLLVYGEYCTVVRGE